MKRYRVGVTAPTLGADNMWNTDPRFEAVILRPREPLPNDIDILCLTGGDDISPTLYDGIQHTSTRPNTSRDKFDKECVLHYAKLPKVGICRGAQFLCAWTGGYLLQDIPDHECGTHKILDVRTKEILYVNSLHHQACIPNANAEILARAFDKVSWFVTPKGRMESLNVDIIEAFYIPEFNSLGVQWHPEFQHHTSKQYFFQLLDQWIMPTIKTETA